MLTHKASINKFEKMENMCNISLDNNGTKLEKNNRRKFENFIDINIKNSQPIGQEKIQKES